MRRLVIAAVFIGVGFCVGCNGGDSHTPPPPPASTPAPTPSPTPTPTLSESASPAPSSSSARASETPLAVMHFETTMPHLSPDMLKAIFLPHSEPVLPADYVLKIELPDGQVITRSRGDYPNLTSLEAGRRMENLFVQNVKMIGGNDAAVGAWPWNVAFLDKNQAPYCGGTLIAASWILTAAHCGPVPGELLRIGGSSLAKKDGVPARVAFNCVNRLYDADTRFSDIALVKLQQPVTQVFASMTPDGNSQAPGTPATAVGWGRNVKGSALLPDRLQQATFPIVDIGSCNESYPNKMKNGMLCAGEKGVARGPCAGDSGGPLLAGGVLEGWRQIGICSWGNICKNDKFPYAVYTKVSDFLPWINETMVAAEPKCKH